MALKLRPTRTLIEVDRDAFSLRLYKRRPFRSKFEPVARYPIAVGMLGHNTPRGFYQVDKKAKNPDWLIPDSQWARDAGLVPGTVVDGRNPYNPIAARWIQLTEDGIGIHGTHDDSSIGSRASHGCIRMHIDDVVQLYDRTPRGTIVFIA